MSLCLEKGLTQMCKKKAPLIERGLYAVVFMILHLNGVHTTSRSYLLLK